MSRLFAWPVPKVWMGLLACTLSVARLIPAAEKPNFIVILTDDQSWVGSSQRMLENDPRTQSDYFRTPNIERLARRGMLFSQGYAPAASCCPTRRAIQTGQAPARHEYSADRESWTETYRRQLNIPRMLQAADARYVTAHFGKWDHRYDLVTPAQQGYDFSDGYTGNGTGGSKNTGGPAATPDPKLIDTLTDQALHFITRNHANGRPFYLQISHYAVHLDIFYNQATFEDIKRNVLPGKKHKMPEFAAMTEDLDSGVGRVLDKLLELKLLENTYVVFMSDNGGRTSIPKAPQSEIDRNEPLRDGKHSFYEGGIRVPFVVLGPGITPGSVSHVPVSGVDLLPTFADLAGYPRPLPSNIDGGSLRQLLFGQGEATVQRPKPFLVFHQAADRKPLSAIRLGNYKLVKSWRDNKAELFNLAVDVSETDDLASRQPGKTQELHGMLMSYLEEVGAEIPSNSRQP